MHLSISVVALLNLKIKSGCSSANFQSSIDYLFAEYSRCHANKKIYL